MMIREEEEKEMKGLVSPTKTIMMVVVIGEDSKTNKEDLNFISNLYQLLTELHKPHRQ